MNLGRQLLTLGRQGVFNPGRPERVVRQLAALRSWGFSIAGELRQAAARSPEAVAVIDERRGEVTYAALLERSERVAVVLHELGLAPGDRLGLLARNHATAVEVIVGASSAGIDLVLVNTGLAAAQLADVAQEQDLRLLVHDEEFGEAVAQAAGALRLVGEDELERLLGQAHVERLSPPERAGRTIVLTSGTTGRPKGARRPTPTGFGPLASICDRIPLRPRANTLIAAPLFHTWGFAALQLSLGLRATIVLRRRFDPEEARALLSEHECEAMFAVPVMLQRMLEAPGAAAARAGDHPAYPHLRVVAVSGSAIPGGIAHRCMDEFGDVLYNLYGSTEASWVSIATPRELRAAPTTAGRPPHGTRVAIVDDADEPVSGSGVGRIFAGNDMVFEGYTSAAAPGLRDGMVPTGDLGHLEDGLLFIDGRADDMIVSGGENVYPAEVEDLLAQHPAVREVAVIGVDDADFGQRLAAYVALEDGADLDADAVRDHVKAHRPRHCVPRDVVFLDVLPRNATGKVVARELRERSGG